MVTEKIMRKITEKRRKNATFRRCQNFSRPISDITQSITLILFKNSIPARFLQLLKIQVGRQLRVWVKMGEFKLHGGRVSDTTRDVNAIRGYRRNQAIFTRVFISLTLTSFLFQGCLNNPQGNPKAIANLATNSGLNSGDPLAGVGQVSSFITIARVLRSNTDPAKIFDIIGDSSGRLGDFCGSAGTGGANQSVCTCRFDYIKSGGVQQVFESPVTYAETNLVRCSHAGVPDNIPFVKVSIHFTNSDSYTNELKFYFTGNSVNLDATDAATFAPIKRFQCKDTVSVSYIGQSDIYDPFLSEDSALSYPMNFYTSNVGFSMQAYVKNAKPSQGAGWNCPSLLNDPGAGLDLTLYSLASDGASKRIFPATGSVFDRHTFHLAREKTGVFTVPLNAYLAPNTLSHTLADGTKTTLDQPGPLGYGAAPIPIAGGESCPSAAQQAIPAGYKWVKVWLMRASLESRTVKVSTKAQELGQIGCNPGAYEEPIQETAQDACKKKGVYKACGTYSTAAGCVDNIASFDGSATTDYPDGGKTAPPDTNRIADRIILGTGACVRLEPNTGTDLFPTTCLASSLVGHGNGIGCTTDDTDPTSQKDAFSGIALGSDVWKLIRKHDPSFDCGKVADPMGLCKPVSDETSTTIQYASIPHDTQLKSLNVDNATSRFDYLFVVSPTSVMMDDMVNERDAIKPYIPYRFYSQKDCQSADPDNPSTAGDCAASKVIRYSPKFHDIGTNGDAPPGDKSGGREIVLPVCALQPI